MSSKFGFLSRYENLAKELIHHILGLKDEDENFTASMEFVMSNLLYHHYLDVNSHTVQRSLEGVSFKMTVHGHQKKAEQLQALINKFLSLSDMEEKGDLKWSVLSFLNEMSQHPARDSLTASFAADIDESLESSKAETVTDWLDDLMERSFQFPDKDDTLSEWSDDDDTLRQSYCSGIEPETQQQPHVKQVQLKEKNPSEEFHLKAPTTPIKEREKRNALLKAVQDSKSWFESSTQKPYWIGNKNEFHVTGSDNNIVLTEYVVMRECIWLLLHPSSGFLFRQEGDKFSVAEPVVLSTLGKNDLKGILKSFALTASKLYTIDKWLNGIETLVLNDPTSCHKNLGGTLLSYADGLRAWRAEHFDEVLNRLEETIVAQEGCQTLLWLMEELRTSFSTLEILYSVHSKAFSSPKDPCLFKSLRLLSLLIQGIESGLKTNDQKCLLVLFQCSIKGYLKRIHSLLWGVGPPSAAALEDFGIIKNGKEDDGTMQKYILQDLPIFCLPGLSFLSTLREILMEICELREIVPDLNFKEDECCDFLQKLVDDRINSVYFEDDKILQNRTSKINNNNNNNNNNSNICSENSCNEFTSTVENDTVINIPKQNDNKYNSNLGDHLESVCENDYDTCETNPFIAKAFDLDQFECDNGDTLLQHTPKKVFEKKNFKDCKGLEPLLKTTLVPVIEKRHAFMSRFLLETLAKTHGLRRQLKVLVSAVLLDSSCAAMQEFYSNLFRKMDSKECLDEGDLTQNLQFCLGIAYPDIAPYFNVVFPQHLKSKRPSSSFPTEEVLSALSLDFSDLWPLCIILKKSHIIKYTKIFQFCLMLKRASFTIERLHFKEIGSHFSFEDQEDSLNSSLYAFGRLSEGGCESGEKTLPLAHRIHRLQLLRQWVLYFARILRDHFSSAVFVPFGAKIEELLDKSNFFDFKQEHEVLLSKTFHECLLDEEALSPIQTTLMQLFLTVERIHDLWVGPPHGIKDAELDLLEEKYSSCHRLVANFLSALASVKFCPLVDGLAQCLAYNCPT